MILNIGVFQYKMRDESPFKKIQRLENNLKKNTTLDLIVCPELFISGYGNHKKIKEWRLNKRIEKTKDRRPDLYEKFIKTKN